MSLRERQQLLAEIWKRVDPRLRSQLEAEFAAAPATALAVGQRRAVLVGQRAAGKSWLLELLGRWLGLPAVDLDQLLETRTERRIADWLPADAVGFRAAERAHFMGVPSPAVVAAGGGFLSLNADLMANEVAILVPVSFETYAERLRVDRARPRLRPELSFEAELREVFVDREGLHAAVPTVRLPAVLRATAGW